MSTIASPRRSIALSSSRRTSASTDTTTTNATTAQQPARRHRAALRDYYNIKIPAPPSSDTNIDSPTSPSDGTASSALDEPNFTAEDYISRLLSGEIDATECGRKYGDEGSVRQSMDSSKGRRPSHSLSQTQSPSGSQAPHGQAHSHQAEMTLETLLRHEARLVTEIRGFDAERKALVYDNYSKLIAASDTIGRVMAAGAGAGAEVGTGLIAMNTGTAGTAIDTTSVPDTVTSPGVGLHATSDDRAGLGTGRNAAAMATLAPALAHIVQTAQTIARARGVGLSDADDTVQGDAENARDMEGDETTAADEMKRATVRWVLGAPERLETLRLALNSAVAAEGEKVDQSPLAPPPPPPLAAATLNLTVSDNNTTVAGPGAVPETDINTKTSSATTRNVTEIRSQMQDEWRRVEELLDRWEGVEGVEELRSRCLRVMDRLPTQT